jgi:hypothetical protein
MYFKPPFPFKNLISWQVVQNKNYQDFDGAAFLRFIS